MRNSGPEQLIRQSLIGFYKDGGRQFWLIFAETPRAAVAAFKARPEIFGAIAKPYNDWPKMRGREHRRLIGCLEALLAEYHTDAVRDREHVETDEPT